MKKTSMKIKIEYYIKEIIYFININLNNIPQIIYIYLLIIFYNDLL